MSATTPTRQRNARGAAPSRSVALQLDAGETPIANLAAEATVLMQMLESARAIDAAGEILAPDDFFNGSNRIAYQVLREMRERGEMADPTTASPLLATRLGITPEEVLGYLFRLREQVWVPAADVEYYAEQIRDAATQRRGEAAGGQIKALFRNAERADEAVATAKVLIEDLEKRGRTRKGPVVHTAEELRRMKFPPAEWLIEKLLPRPSFAILAGPPKAKKSFLALDLACAFALGGHALGKFPVAEHPSLCCFTEDSFEEVKERLSRQFSGSIWPENMHVTEACPRMDEGGEAWLHNFLGTHPEVEFVVLDPLVNVRGAGRKGEGNTYYHDYDDLAPFKRLARQHRVFLLLIHHTNKRVTSDPYQLISGSQGVQGSVDLVMVLETDAEVLTATLHMRGRRVKPQKRRQRWDDHVGWVDEGEGEAPAAAEAHLTKRQAQALAVLRAHGEPLGFNAWTALVSSRLEISGSAAKSIVNEVKSSPLLSKEGSVYWFTTPAEKATSPTSPTGATSATEATSPEGEIQGNLLVGEVGRVGSVAEVGKVALRTPTGPLPPPLDLPEELPEADRQAHQRAFGLGWTGGFPALSLGEGMQIEAGEEAWRWACTSWHVSIIGRVPGLLGAAP